MSVKGCHGKLYLFVHRHVCCQSPIDVCSEINSQPPGSNFFQRMAEQCRPALTFSAHACASALRVARSCCTLGPYTPVDPVLSIKYEPPGSNFFQRMAEQCRPALTFSAHACASALRVARSCCTLGPYTPVDPVLSIKYRQCHQIHSHKRTSLVCLSRIQDFVTFSEKRLKWITCTYE